MLDATAAAKRANGPLVRKRSLTQRNTKERDRLRKLLKMSNRGSLSKAFQGNCYSDLDRTTNSN